MNLDNVPKFVINLEKRKDRLEHIQKEMDYVGWDFELFKAIDENSYVGCTKSHLNIITKAIQNNYDSVLVIEDDCTFMPYAKDFIEKINNHSENLNFSIINFAPTLNRPVSISKENNLFLDITNLPEKLGHHRDIFATNMILYHSSIYDDVLKISGNTLDSPYYHAIDEFLFKYIISKKQSYCPILPLAPQMKSWSDVSQGEYSNFYTQTYNWNSYSPMKIPGEFMDYERNQQLKEKKEHQKFYYVS